MVSNAAEIYTKVAQGPEASAPSQPSVLYPATIDNADASQVPASGKRRGAIVTTVMLMGVMGALATAWSFRKALTVLMLRGEQDLGTISKADTKKFIEVPRGLCEEYSWEIISDDNKCIEAARALELATNDLVNMTVAQWPHGCNYFRNATAGGPDTLFMNRNPSYQGDGKSTTDLAQGGLRELICSLPDAADDTLEPADEEPAATSVSRGATASSETKGKAPAKKPAQNVAVGSDGTAEEDASEVTCTFTVGKEGENACPEGSIPLIESECRQMPYHFGGSIHVPFEVDNEVDPAGCFFNYPYYYYNTNPLGAAGDQMTVYCKRCEVGGKGTEKMDVSGDWTEWDDKDGDVISRRYRKIAMGTCSDMSWYPIWSIRKCKEAAQELGLADPENANPMVTTLAERPAGCYYFRNYQDGTGTIWMSMSPYSKDNGAETSDLAQGQLRQPICGDEEEDAPLADNLKGEKPRFFKVSKGTCAEAGATPITSQLTCEAAARSLGLSDTISTITEEENRPEGCYYFRNFEDLTATLWVNTNQASKGKGAETSDEEKGWERQPICETDAPIVMGSSKYKMLSKGNCELNGLEVVRDQDECRVAAKELNLQNVGGLADPTPIVADLSDSPEGCYYFWNSGDSSGTLWLNTSPDATGKGAASQEDEGLLRQQICSSNDAQIIDAQPAGVAAAGALEEEFSAEAPADTRVLLNPSSQAATGGYGTRMTG